MIAQILELLKVTDVNQSEIIDKAKGINKLPQTWVEFKKALKWQRKGK